MSRRKAREMAFKCIYQLSFDINQDVDKLLEYMKTEDEEETKISEENIEDYVKKSVKGVVSSLNEIDKEISSNLKNWTMDRISKIDLALLRLAIYEIKYMENIPVKVSVNEALEIAKNYGNDDSVKFINGILATLIASQNGC